ncbi:NACHT domain-containing protein [Sansalvadorimonas sp. 2012CJ34-2]|uniref:NACHT domain-containing protein n=1 Tax=Parendozoicomonas callyspongiae TaxID=2942213 RepID=A0ABT0PLI6_9GAMM|nr:NACHT domain-containing protein [Sansalvadorimonas sp. 2012CJ34-2]MCL6272247.1 NACHT domain-containing protein [Sansalvadorimonas sp. 2012CJ34-2]
MQALHANQHQHQGFFVSSVLEVLGRIESYLESFKQNKNANDARKLGEAICRVILINSDNQSTKELCKATKFQVLIDSLSKKNLSENENHLKKIKADLNTLQTLGNIESHDNNVGLNDNDLESIEESIKNLFRNVFDNKEYIDIDEKIPVSIYKYINKSVTENEDWRCDKIISIVYPNRDIEKVREEKDFQFYTLPDVNNKKLGFVFLGRNISFSSSLSKLFKDSEIKIKGLISLTFLFPKEISKTTGKEVKNRKNNILKKCSPYEKDFPNVDFTHEFIEDYIWNHCLTNSLKESSNVTTEPYFIDQWLYKDNTEKLSLIFLDEIASHTSSDDKPIHILLGDGGVGKTTFCEQVVQKLDQQLAKGSKKKALLLSSFDLPEEISGADESIDSIQSLYRILQDDPDTTLNSHNLALNISSGNILIIIDGLDEIESKLKEKFNLDAFIDSVIELNDTYLNCSVIITSRENNSEKFDRNKVNVYQLKGFDECLIKKYLKVRYNHKSKHSGKGYDNKVLDYISTLSLDSDKKVTPLIMRLLCELVESQAGSSVTQEISKSNYFKDDNPLDQVIHQIINRDIIKQDIDISCDDYFDILKDIVFDYSCNISKTDLDELLKYSHLGADEQNTKEFTNFYVSPLFQRVGNNFRIKHDSLEFWIKARYISHKINTTTRENSKGVLKIISRDCYKGGSLVKEIASTSKPDRHEYFRSAIQDILDDLEESKVNMQLSRKTISSMLYLAMSSEIRTKENYSKILLALFGKNDGQRIKYLSIYGDFFPLDFKDFTVLNGYFSGYSNLGKSSIPEGKAVFIDCEFKDIDTSNFGKNSITDVNFDNCILPDNIKSIINTGVQNKQERIDNIKSDLKKIFKVGFKQNSFVWKSDQLYKQQCASLKHKIILSKYLDILKTEGFLNRESAKGAAGNGYRLNNNSENEVKDFITQGILGENISNLIETISV